LIQRERIIALTSEETVVGLMSAYGRRDGEVPMIGMVIRQENTMLRRMMMIAIMAGLVKFSKSLMQRRMQVGW
jgi:hypothetical protein